MIVTPNLIAVNHNGHRYVPGEEFEIDRAGYARIAGHLDVIDDEDKPAAEKPLEKQSVAELKAYAELHNIDLGDADKKPAILAAILAAQQAGGAPNGGTGDGDQQ
ncbi:hypothetical protein [Cohnella nanjingensis]|uniref:Rho termination factor N-terminal domain-containing protein n=1 Tax=Cohnella nanjingensis TaxID=1387779 RepID=A0A7X0RN06_9BACL|nr:hypothetical protein [Cohnella nanjingensis]MBB6670273.1 hypothetical protein [Cohnella nanjingensis]